MGGDKVMYKYEEILIIEDIEFKRYYHHDKIRTRYFVSRDSRILSGISNRILKPNLTLKGYYKVGLYIDSKIKAHPITVHKIVATVYCGGYHEGYDVDHVDGNKINNNADNLEWVTRSVNIKRAFDNKLKIAKRGDDNGATKYPDKLIVDACELIKSGCSIVDAATITSIPLSYLYTIIRGESRTDIVNGYNFNKNIYTLEMVRHDESVKTKIVELYRSGCSPKKIKKILNIDNSNVIYNILGRYKNI